MEVVSAVCTVQSTYMTTLQSRKEYDTIQSVTESYISLCWKGPYRQFHPNPPPWAGTCEQYTRQGLKRVDISPPSTRCLHFFCFSPGYNQLSGMKVCTAGSYPIFHSLYPQALLHITTLNPIVCTGVWYCHNPDTAPCVWPC